MTPTNPITEARGATSRCNDRDYGIINNALDYQAAEIERLRADLAVSNRSLEQWQKLASSNKDEVMRLKAKLAKAEEVIADIRRLGDIVSHATLQKGPPARVRLSDGSIVTGEIAQVFEALALAVVSASDKAAQFTKGEEG